MRFGIRQRDRGYGRLLCFGGCESPTPLPPPHRWPVSVEKRELSVAR